MADDVKIFGRDKTCETCRFFDEHETNSTVGLCRRLTPVIVPSWAANREALTDLLDASRWPTVSFADWCGEWRAKPQDMSEVVEAIRTARQRIKDMER